MTHAPADLRYPIGPFKAVMPVTHELRGAAIDALEVSGADSRSGRRPEQRTTGYAVSARRLDGASGRSHVADSHMNALIRVKLALTEDTPTIKPYDENAWSTLPDMKLPVDVSLSLIDSIHTRWVAVVNAMAADQFALHSSIPS